jgi:PIN domain nuclease of toxin-antitoxin system
LKLLLDTHIWIWSLLDPRKLAPLMAAALENPHNELWLSPISVWELLILVETRRIELDAPPEEWVRNALAAAPLMEAPVTHEVALESRRLRLPHNDPADHFLAATARVYQLTLATADDRLQAVDGLSVLPNR